MPTIALLGTLDTKLAEFLHLRSLILTAGGADTSVLLIDVGRSETKHADITITQPEVLKYGASATSGTDIATLPRGALITHMISCATALLSDLHKSSRIHAVLSAGGSGGSSLAAAAMRGALPLGFPKLLVSTIASGDVGPLVDGTDLGVMYSIVDVAGWNSMLERVFANAAGAVVGMARGYQARLEAVEREDAIGTGQRQKRVVRVGVTMFGVTTPCVDVLREYLERREDPKYDVYVFHATGTGGRAMERMVRAGELDAVADVTTTEIADHLMGGNMSAGEKRLEAAAEAGVPYVVSVGAVDMVNFGPKDTVPAHYATRTLFEHNPTVTLMRTSPEENARIGAFVAKKLRDFSATPAKVKVMLPLGAVSILSAPGQAFADRHADEALFEAVKDGLAGSEVEVVEDEREINDKEFAVKIAECLVGLVEGAREGEGGSSDG